MTARETSSDCERWAPGDPTKNPPHDQRFLEAVVDAGFDAFTHRGGLFGGQSDHRAVVIVHRGRGKIWEVVFQESDRDVVTTTTSNLERLTTTILSWLRGNPLTAEEDSLHAVAG